jgi:endonuclease/exonuclease/phosphatase family metal-dependent hydrolase
MSDSNATFKKLTGRWNRNILMMGDLNDEPADRSVLEELKAASGEDKLEEPMKTSSGRKTPTPKSYFKRNAYLYNYMWDLYARPDEGTYFYSGSTNTMNVLDHFIVSRGLFYGCSELLLDPQSVGVFKHGPMTSKKGRPIAFDKKTKKGFSDHFPVVAVINTVSANQASNKCQ